MVVMSLSFCAGWSGCCSILGWLLTDKDNSTYQGQHLVSVKFDSVAIKVDDLIYHQGVHKQRVGRQRLQAVDRFRYASLEPLREV